MTHTAWRSACAACLVLAAAFAAFHGITRGFRTITADGARQADLQRAPRKLPALGLVDQDGRRFLLSDMAGQGADWTIATLVYTQCVAICRTSASGMVLLKEALAERGLGGKVRLLTLSFDPGRDTPARLAAYARQLGSDTQWWRFATVEQAGGLPTLLKLFGIVVLPDGLGGYSHNAALFLIDATGHLVRAYDVERPDRLLADLVSAESWP